MTEERPIDEADHCPPEGYPVFVSLAHERHQEACRRATLEERSLGGLMRQALFTYLDQVKATDEH